MNYKKSEQIVLCLTTTGSQKLTKTFDNQKESKIGTSLSFRHEECQVPNIEVLYSLLRRVEHRPDTVIVSGVLNSKARKLKTISRKKEHIIDKKRAWLCLDVDNFHLPSGYDVVSKPKPCVEYFVTNGLPQVFSNTQYVYQLSSSCGVRSRDILKAHIFFMLEKPMELKDIKQTLSNCEYIDPSTLNPTQMIYIAKPIFENAADDPYKSQSRVGLVQMSGYSPSVLLNRDKAKSPKTKTSKKSVKKADYVSAHDELKRLYNELGDGIGKLGFYEPILKYSARIVTNSWHKYVLDHLGDIKRDIRDAIDNTEVSEYRDTNDLVRYSSDEFLDGLIYNAIRKDFGNKKRDSIDDRYQKYPVKLYDAQVLMKKVFQLISTPLIENIQVKSRFPNADMPNKRNFTKLIKATAGLGKTSEVIYYLNKFLTIERPIPINFELYVPSHRLGTEIVESIKSYKLQCHTYPLHKPHIEASHIVGRTQSKNGIDVCNRKSEVEDATKLGVAVGKELCGEHLKEGDDNRCRFFNKCEYQKQFRTWKERKSDQHVYIMSHDYLFIKRRDGLPKPDFVVIDETFYGKSIKEITIEQPLAIFNEYDDSSVINAIRQYTKDKSSLLRIFKEKNITPDEIRKLARSFKGREDDGVKKYLAFDVVLEGLADELEIFPDRNESRLLKVSSSVKEGEEKIILEYRKRRELTVPTDTPLLMIDADGDKDIAQLFRKEHQLSDNVVEAERIAVVNQFYDRTWSRNSLLGSDKLKEQTLKFLTCLSADDTVIVMDKQLVDKLGFRREQKIINGEHTARYYCKNSPVIHFGGFRGTNEFKDYNNIIIVGRSEPPVRSMEHQAAALWYDDDKDITTIPIDSSGNINYEKRQVAYRMADGSVKSAKVSSHPDERVDKLLRLARDSESTQAIDRLRSVRSAQTGDDAPKTIWLLCNIPLDITVTNLLNWDMYQTLIEIVNTEDCFIVHRDFSYFKKMEQSVRSRNLPKWKNMHFANRYSIRQMHEIQFWVINDSNSPFTAFISSKYTGSVEALIASELGLSEVDILIEEKDK